MSQHPQARKTNALNPNLVAFILAINFVVIGGFILAYLPPTGSADGLEIVIAPTSTPMPTATPLPPTEAPTQPPTDTPAPTATPLPPTEAPTQPPTEMPATEAGPAVGGPDPALVAQGQQLFLLCSACHGADARGLPNLGKDLVDSEFVAEQSDDDLVQFIITGRPIWDPLNTTGIDMPGRGGNPALTTDEIYAIVAYLRSLAAAGG